jgi:hypothetical protein
MPTINQWNSKNVVFGQAWVNTVLAAYKTLPTTALILATAKIRLNNSPTFNPQPSMTPAINAATECAYSGYTAGGILAVQSAPVALSPNVNGEVISALFEATVVTPFVPDMAYGYWIDDGTNVILAEAFGGSNIAPFGAPFQFLQLNILLPFYFFQGTS